MVTPLKTATANDVMNSSSTLIVLQGLAGNEPTQLNALQIFLVPHLEILTALWVATWWTTASVLVIIYFNRYRDRKEK